MVNPTTPTPTPAPKTFPIDAPLSDAADDTAQRADADGSTSQDGGDADATIDDDAAGGVEIGEPVPEKDRTVRAVQGEEQLPSEDHAASVDPDPDPSSERH